MDTEYGTCWQMIVLLLSGEYYMHDGGSGLICRQMEMLNVFMGVCLMPRGKRATELMV